MKEYHKIQTVYKRNPETKNKNLLEGEYSYPEFEYLKDNIWVFTEKVDGTNIRVMFDGKDIVFGGKTDNAQIPTFLNKKLQDKFLTIEKRLLFESQFSKESKVCFYGEGYGDRIQGIGGNYRKDQDFILFDIKIDNYWLKREDLESIAEIFGIDIVPIIGKGTIKDMIEMTKKGFNSIWGNFIAEGIVARPEIELMTRNGQRIITKIKHKDFI